MCELGSIYLFSIVSAKKHSKLSKMLLQQTFVALDTLIEGGNLRRIYAVAATPDGEQEVLRQNGFLQIKSPRKGLMGTPCF